MNRKEQLRCAVLLNICRHYITITDLFGNTVFIFDLLHFIHRFGNIGIVTRDQKMSVFVVATTVTDNINKLLVDLISRLIQLILCHITGKSLLCRIISNRIATLTDCINQTITELLVCTLKDQVVRVSFKTLCNLCPVCLISCPCFCTQLFIRDRNILAICILFCHIFLNLITVLIYDFPILAGTKLSPPLIVPVIVDNDIHTIVQSIVDNLFHTSKVLIFNRISTIINICIGPCNRNTQCIDTIRMYFIDISLCRDRLFPCSLTILRCHVLVILGLVSRFCLL